MSQPCPSDEVLGAFAEGLVDDARRAAVEAHLADCADCCLLVGAAGDDGRRVSVLQPPPSTTEGSTTQGSVPPVSLAHAERVPPTIGRYRTSGELGRGAMGRVLRAHDPVLGRDVAIKLILGHLMTPRHRERFGREARALGRLHHPNVVQVFDTGEVAGDPFMVIELVDGTDLRAWAVDRPQQEVLRCLRAAGAGLAAAHAAGILHRDFKPANVLVGKDGRPRVGDFGLATSASGPPTEPYGSAPVSGAGSLTGTGWVLGTPAYMAPEQLRGKSASEKSDQFAFCVTAWELLFGRRPFGGGTAGELLGAMGRGVAFPADRRGVPVATLGALRKGLAVEPNERHRDMTTLLDALRFRRGRSRIAWVLVGATALSAGAVAFGAGPAAPSCEDVARSIDATWNDPVARALEERARHSGLAYAPASIAGLTKRLDDYRTHWRDERQRLCRAHADPGTSAVGDREALCLTRWRDQAATALKWALDPQTPVEHIPALFDGLRDPSHCAELTSEEARDVSGQRPELQALAARLDDVQAQMVARRFADAAETLAALGPALAVQQHPALLARHRLLAGRLAHTEGDTDVALVRLETAFDIAARNGLDQLAAEAATELMKVHQRLFDRPHLERWARHASAHLERLGDPAATARFELARARALIAMGTDEEAAAAMEVVVARIEKTGSEVSTSRADAHYTIGVWAMSQFQYDQARLHLEADLELLETLHGVRHPATRRALLGLVELDAVQGVDGNTDAYLARLASVTDAAYGPDDAHQAEVAMMEARVAAKRGDVARAKREFERGLALLGDEANVAPLLVRLRAGLAEVLADMDDHEGALALRLEGLDTMVALTGPRSSHSGIAQTFVANEYQALGRSEEAERHYRDAVEVVEQAVPLDSPMLLVARTGLGRNLLEQGNAAAAIQTLETARRDADPSLGSKENHAQATFALARALTAMPAHLDATMATQRARTLAREARAASESDTLHAEIDSWLQAH